MPESITVKCPKCGQSLAAKYTVSIAYGTLEFQKLLNGTLNCCKCPGCGSVFKIDGMIVYRETEPPFILIQKELPLDEDTEAIEKDVDTIMTDVSIANDMARPTVRLVFTREDFLEKIFLQRSGLDDRMIEYVKYQLYQGGTDSLLSRAKYRLLYDFSAHDEENLVFAVFDRETNKPVNGLQVPRKQYAKLCEEFDLNPDMQKQLELLFPNCVVSVDRLYNNA